MIPEDIKKCKKNNRVWKSNGNNPECSKNYLTDDQLETFPWLHATKDAAQRAIDNRNRERRFVKIPDIYPPLPSGYIPLGFGGTFKTKGCFIGGAADTKDELNWSNAGDGFMWSGTAKENFYITPRNSEIAKLNYPWLAEEESNSKKNSPSKNKSPIVGKNTKIIISELPDVGLALNVVKNALKQKISGEIDNINVNGEEMEEHRCHLFALDDIKEYLLGK